MTARDDEDDAAMRAVVLAGIRSRKSLREIALDLYGADQVEAEWHGDSWMRAVVRWLVDRVEASSDERPCNAGPETP